MKKKLALIFLLGISSIMLGWQHIENKVYHGVLKALLSHSVPEVGISEISDSDDFVFLDTREKNEFGISHINGAHWVGYEDFQLDRLIGFSKHTPIVVYCSVGYRSEKIGEKLIEAGYSNVQNLYGGIFEWKNQGHKVWNDTGETEKVHAFDKFWGVWLTKGEKVYTP